jgi:hypothetical protein
MPRASIADLIKGTIACGQSELANTIRMLVYRTRPDLFDLLDFNDDHTFLEPLLFAFFTADQAPIALEQILYGYLEDDRKPDVLSVSSDRHGIVHLANIGALKTPLANRELLVFRDSAAGWYRCQDNSAVVPAELVSPLKVQGTGIEICGFQHPLLMRFFTDDQGRMVNVEVTETTTRRHIEHLNTAFGIIKNHCRNDYDDIIAVTRRIVLYHSDHQNSFATLSAHGIAFFNIDETHDEVFFLDDIAHQCGHVIFNAITQEKVKLLTIDPETPLRRFNGDEYDMRTIYSALHGLFTFSLINRVLNTCYEQHTWSGRQQHELLGRLSFNMKKFKIDLMNLNRQDIFTDLGWVFFNYFKRVYRGIYGRRRSIIDSLDQSNQPYVFSYERFVERNPLGAMEKLVSR